MQGWKLQGGDEGCEGSPLDLGGIKWPAGVGLDSMVSSPDVLSRAEDVLAELRMSSSISNGRCWEGNVRAR